MLHRLTIRDFVIVDCLELEFKQGFSALTGETGAGKSILLDALGLVLGGRAESGIVRTGQARADITAEFDLPDAPMLLAWLAEQALPADEDMLLMRRVVETGGRTRAWINGVPVTLMQLREVGDWLADIHGQHAHYALLRNDAQRALLDTQAGAQALAAEVAGRYREWHRLTELRRHAEEDSAASERERDLLGWQIKELDELAFDAGEWAELNSDHARFAHAANLIEGAGELVSLLGESDISVSALLQQTCARIGSMAEVDAGLEETRALLAGVTIQTDEALHTLRRYLDRLELDPERLSDIERRIEAVTSVARKYRIAPDALPELHEKWLQALEELEVRGNPERLAEQEAQAHNAYKCAAQQLTALRIPAAQTLSREVTRTMQTLAMAGGHFEVALLPLEQGSAHGLENIEFQVAANPSQTLRPMAKVASGGELSRIGLAIQVLTSRSASVPTLIFDEVDVGIGGSVAEIVGKLLRELGLQRQVLCVTHLPQVAACANWQWNIAKTERDGEALSNVNLLDEAGRVEEIARMLGGVNITATTRQHAAEMLGLTSQ